MLVLTLKLIYIIVVLNLSGIELHYYIRKKHKEKDGWIYLGSGMIFFVYGIVSAINWF